MLCITYKTWLMPTDIDISQHCQQILPPRPRGSYPNRGSWAVHPWM
jgi:hypothetical protein